MNKIENMNLILNKEDMKFSIAHFTIFNKTSRENIHGHNFSVSFELEFTRKKNGMLKDYKIYKQLIRNLCDSIDEHLILPEKNKFIKIKKNDEKVIVLFDKEELIFLSRDVLILPIQNTTVEDFSEWFLLEVVKDPSLKDKDGINSLKLNVSSYKGQSCTSIMSFKKTKS